MRSVAAVVGILGCAGCGVDLLNNKALHAHVDDLVQNDPANARRADRVSLDAELLVPIFGTYRLDQRVFGSSRPSGIVFDWILGGVAPVALAGSSFLVDDPDTRSALRWSALGLYGATRIAVEIIGNLHISEYNRYLGQQQSRAAAPIGLSLSW
ncbi:MAG TPA: hypothetical protein VGM39_10090 [Kofleriaceae bacterium]